MFDISSIVVQNVIQLLPICYMYQIWEMCQQFYAMDQYNEVWKSTKHVGCVLVYVLADLATQIFVHVECWFMFMASIEFLRYAFETIYPTSDTNYTYTSTVSTPHVPTIIVLVG